MEDSIGPLALPTSCHFLFDIRGHLESLSGCTSGMSPRERGFCEDLVLHSRNILEPIFLPTHAIKLTFPSRTAPDTRRTRAFKSFRVLYIPAQILPRGLFIGQLEFSVVNSNVSTGRNGTTLETGDTRRFRSSMQPNNGNITNLELRIGAVPFPWGATESSTL